jgi:hypothetical protein
MTKSFLFRACLLVVAAIMTLVPASAQRSGRGEPEPTRLAPPAAPSDRQYLRDVAEQGSVRLIVTLDVDQPGRMAFATMSEQSQRAVIAQSQNALLAELGMTRSSAGVKRYTALPLLAIEASAEQFELLERSSLAAHIREDRWREPSLLEATGNIGMRGADGAWNAGADGEGQVVVIVDSGVSNTHSYLAGKVLDEVCYSTNASPSGFTVTSVCPGSAPFSEAIGSAAPCQLIDPNAQAAGECHHGTHIANIAAGDQPDANIYDGVAREADILAVQIFSRIKDDVNPGTPSVCVRTNYPYDECILAADSDILAGLDYILTNWADTHEIAAVNMSFGNESWDSQAACDAEYPDYVAAVAALLAEDIAVVSSSGNQYSTVSMNAPACISGVISVGASCDVSAPGCTVNTIADFTNSAPFLTFLAPGVNVDAATPDVFGHAVKTGTSQAAAFVSGSLAALRSYRPGTSVAQMRSALQQSGIPVDDYATGVIEVYPKIQVDAALDLLIYPDEPALLLPEENAAFAETPITFKWTGGADTTSYRIEVWNENKVKRLVHAGVDHEECAEDVEYPDEDLVCTADIEYEDFKDNKNYYWRVVARNTDIGRTTNSVWRLFQFDTPGAPLLVAPEHKTTINQPEELVAFQWDEVALADRYRVTLYDTSNGSVKINTSELEEGDVCNIDGLCTYATVSADLTDLKDDKKYKWYVTSISDDGTSKSTEWVIKAKFPAAPVLLSPATGHQFTSLADIELTWTEVAGADEYFIKIIDLGNDKAVVKETLVIEARAIDCLSGVCTYAPSPEHEVAFKNKHTYRWTVRAANELGENESKPLTFRTKFPAPPVLVSPASPITLQDPAITFQFTQIADADSYDLIIKLKSSGKKVLERGLTPGSSLSCDGTHCSYTLNSSDQSKLKNTKTYRWFVKSVSEAGKSGSDKREFTILSPLPPTLQTPVDGAKLHSPTDAVFVWTDVGGGANYKFRLKDTSNGKKIAKVNVSNAACIAGTCSYTLGSQQDDLKDGRTYLWWVVSTNDLGSSKSSKYELDTQFPRKPQPLSPADQMTLTDAANLTTFEWTSGGTSSPVTYRLRLQRTDNKDMLVDETFTNGAGLACDAAKCAYAVPDQVRIDLRSDRKYKWWIVATSGHGEKTGDKFKFTTQFP